MKNIFLILFLTIQNVFVFPELDADLLRYQLKCSYKKDIEFSFEGSMKCILRGKDKFKQ